METLNTEGFLLTEIAGEWSVLSADFGDGYEAAALVGDPAGARTWSMKIDVLPGDIDIAPPVSGSTRAAYLWQFFVTSKVANDEPFWVEAEDPDDGTRKLFLASFADHRLTYTVLCAKVYSTGLQLRQRRLVDVASPVAVT